MGLTLPKQIHLAFYVAGLETCDTDVLNVKKQSDAVGVRSQEEGLVL